LNLSLLKINNVLGGLKPLNLARLLFVYAMFGAFNLPCSKHGIDKQQPSTRVESEGGFALFMHDFYFFSYLSRPETGDS
jgi:hypothetical protein